LYLTNIICQFPAAISRRSLVTQSNVPVHTAIKWRLLQSGRTCSRTVFPARCSELACLSALTLRSHCKFC